MKDREAPSGRTIVEVLDAFTLLGRPLHVIQVRFRERGAKNVGRGTELFVEGDPSRRVVVHFGNPRGRPAPGTDLASFHERYSLTVALRGVDPDRLPGTILVARESAEGGG